MHELHDLSALSVTEKDALILALFEQGERVTATVQAFSARVRELSWKGGCARTVISPASRPNRWAYPAGTNRAGQAGALGNDTEERVATPDVITRCPNSLYRRSSPSVPM